MVVALGGRHPRVRRAELGLHPMHQVVKLADRSHLREERLVGVEDGGAVDGGEAARMGAAQRRRPPFVEELPPLGGRIELEVHARA